MPDAPPAEPSEERRADVEAFVEEQVGDLDLAPALDARLRSRIRDLALGRATVHAPVAGGVVPANGADGAQATPPLRGPTQG